MNITADQLERWGRMTEYRGDALKHELHEAYVKAVLEESEAQERGSGAQWRNEIGEPVACTGTVTHHEGVFCPVHKDG